MREKWTGKIYWFVCLLFKGIVLPSRCWERVLLSAVFLSSLCLCIYLCVFVTSLSLYIYLSLYQRLAGHLSHRMGCLVFMILLVRYWLSTGALSLSAVCVYLCMCCFTGFWGVSWAHWLWIHLLLSAQQQQKCFSFLFRTMTEISIMQPCTYCQDFNIFLSVLCSRVLCWWPYAQSAPFHQAWELSAFQHLILNVHRMSVSVPNCFAQ